MKANVLDLNGKPKSQIELPAIFKVPVRPDVIKRSYLALESHTRQPYGSDPMAGLRTSAHYHGKRRVRYTMMMVNKARRPRLHRTSTNMMWRVRRIPSSVKGRRAHPPLIEKVWDQKINDKERRLALNSAFASTVSHDFVCLRGHIIGEIKLPIVVEDDIQKLKRSKEIEQLLSKLGLEKELERVKEKKVRAGKGKMRGRKYKRKVGPLIVVGEDKGIKNAGKNLAGVEVKNVKNVSVKDLAPGASPGRLTIYSKSAIEYLKGS
ncbi:50S ribosomal protein L4 [Candidatus Micrarchaeota archaeon RBG_16_49_10]|nr:50S ribosomal protein L4P, large subunit ribosomal protein L4e [uncultured archaeon]OGI15392.1 MAG: 50S ribosomal protein L4 [Candidatus Micrarchaeota archaeon RBG_16_49_10]